MDAATIMAARATDILLGRSVHPSRQEIVKILPASPPRRGEFVLVDGERCRVTRCRIIHTGNVWEIRSLRVRKA
jgi:hypothetical protein